METCRIILRFKLTDYNFFTKLNLFKSFYLAKNCNLKFNLLFYLLNINFWHNIYLLYKLNLLNFLIKNIKTNESAFNVIWR